MIFFWKRRQETVQQTFTIGWVLLTYKYSAVHTGKFVYAGFTNFFSAKKNIITVRISQFLFSNFKKSNKKDSVKLIYYNSISQVFFCPGLFYFSFSFLPTIGSNLIHKLEIINYAPKVVSALRLLWYFGCC